MPTGLRSCVISFGQVGFELLPRLRRFLIELLEDRFLSRVTQSILRNRRVMLLTDMPAVRFGNDPRTII